jgi:hypothetical protein
MGSENCYQVKAWDISRQMDTMYIVIAGDFDEAVIKAQEHAKYNRYNVFSVEYVGSIAVYGGKNE